MPPYFNLLSLAFFSFCYSAGVKLHPYSERLNILCLLIVFDCYNRSGNALWQVYFTKCLISQVITVILAADVWKIKAQFSSVGLVTTVLSSDSICTSDMNQRFLISENCFIISHEKNKCKNWRIWFLLTSVLFKSFFNRCIWENRFSGIVEKYFSHKCEHNFSLLSSAL